MDKNVPNELCQVHIKVALLMGYTVCTACNINAQTNEELPRNNPGVGFSTLPSFCGMRTFACLHSVRGAQVQSW